MTQIDEIKLSKPALRALHGSGYVNLDHFTKLTEKEVLALHGVGPRAIMELSKALKAKGLSFRTKE